MYIARKDTVLKATYPPPPPPRALSISLPLSCTQLTYAHGCPHLPRAQYIYHCLHIVGTYLFEKLVYAFDDCLFCKPELDKDKDGSTVWLLLLLLH